MSDIDERIREKEKLLAQLNKHLEQIEREQAKTRWYQRLFIFIMFVVVVPISVMALAFGELVWMLPIAMVLYMVNEMGKMDD